MELSVAICTHNPRRQYLSRVLDALRNQSLDKQQWALLVVDNASREPLRDSWDLSWHPHGRHVREDRLGLPVARLRAVKELSTDLTVFVDDDTVLAPDYLSQALKIKREWSHLGVWGSGCISPEFEVQPDNQFHEFLPSLTLREVKSPRWSNTYPATGLYPEVTPWGAGQCVRMEVSQAYRRIDELSPIRMSSSALLSKLRGRTTEDVEICIAACSLGWGMGIFPQLQITHLIPKERVTEEYLLKIREFTGASNLLLEYKWQGVVPYNPFSPRGMARVVRHTLVKSSFRRRMHLAGVRAAMRARSIIRASQKYANQKGQ